MIPHGLLSGIDILLVAPLLLGFHYRRKLAPTLRFAWYAALVAIVVFHSVLLCQEMWANVLALREGDFLGFWINAHVAAAGHNVYDPAYGRALVRPFTISDEFRREIIDVGFWYPPPSIFVFLPLAFFADPHHALLVWYVFQTIALLAAVAILARTFLRSDGVAGVALVAALILMLPATSLNVWYGQTTFLALLFAALFWNARLFARGGAWLVLAACVKPFIGALSLVLICRRRLRSLAGFAAGALVICAATAATFGLSTFVTYFHARPDSRIPALVYGEVSNESLLGFIVRFTHGLNGDHLSHGAVVAFGAIAFVLTGITLWLCLRSKEADEQVLLALMLSLALLIYPASQVFYSVLLVIPALLLWSRRSATFPPWMVATGIAVGYALTIVKFPVFATLLTWVTFGILALPDRVRGEVRQFASLGWSRIGKLGSQTQSTTRTATALTIIGFFVLLCVGAQFAARPQHSFFTSSGTDFRAFYCSGAAANAKRSPYHIEPLRSCEHRVQPARGWSDALVVPAPLPGYDIAFFAVLARLPYVAAKSIWFAVIVASLLLSVFFLSRLTRFPALPILLGLCLTDAYQSIVYGQLPPVAVAGLCGAAYFLQRGRHGVAAIAAGVSMIEPHLGLPAFIAVFIWSARARLPLIGVAAILSASAALAIGVGGNIEYFTHVLPQHAAAELVAIDQYGLAHELHVAGFSDRNALAIGSLSYVIMAGIGLLLSRRIATKTGQAGFIVLIPPAAALLGGAFVHGTQFAAALPAAFLLLSSARDKASRFSAAFALALLIVPWDLLIPSGARIGPMVLIALIVLVWVTFAVFSGATVRERSAVAATAGLAFVALLLLMHHLPGSKTSFASEPVLPASALLADADASANWAAYLRSESNLSLPSIRDEAAKIPNWAAIVLLLLATTALTRQQKETSTGFASGEVALSSVHGY